MTKTCNTCGKIHESIPANSKAASYGVVADCDCGSTLLWPAPNWREILRAELETE